MSNMPHSSPRRKSLCKLSHALCLAAVFASFCAVTGAAHAGRSCEPTAMTSQQIGQSLQLAVRTAAALNTEYARNGTQVVVLARAGQDLSKYGVRDSHLGWAYRTGQGAWRVVHKLNQCGTATGQVYRQGLGEFFLDDLWRYEAAWAVPMPEVQQALLPVLTDNARAKALHHSAYSMVSYVWGRRYQQSNQWAIETLALAMEPRTALNREQAQAWLRFKGYQPSTLRLGPLTRMGARVGSANIAFDDHPNDKRYSDRIETVTVDSVFEWLERAQLAGPAVRL